MSPPLVFLERGDATSLFKVSARSRQLQFQSSLDDTQAMSSNWSGACIRDNEGETYTRIQGSWVVPRPYPPPPPNCRRGLAAGYQRCDCLARIGRLRSGKHRDAAARDIPEGRREHCHEEPGRPGDIGVPHGGSGGRSTTTGRRSASRTSMFPLQVGDLVYAELDVINPRKVRFFLKNLSLGTVFPPFDLDQPSASPTNPNFPVTVEGRTAEWIVERQTEAVTRPICVRSATMARSCSTAATPQVHTATGAIRGPTA